MKYGYSYCINVTCQKKFVPVAKDQVCCLECEAKEKEKSVDTKLRKCLFGNHMFESDGPWHRTCSQCKNRRDYNEQNGNGIDNASIVRASSKGPFKD